MTTKRRPHHWRIPPFSRGVAKCLVKYTAQKRFAMLDVASEGLLMDKTGFVQNFDKDARVVGDKVNLFSTLRAATMQDRL